MKQWDDLAAKYGLNILSQKNILWPALTKKLTNKFRGKVVLDIGCGKGEYTLFFYKNGADITGIDSSAEQIKLANKINSGPTYILSSGQEYKSKKPIDYLFANMVLCNISSEKELHALFKNAFCISQKNSSFYLTNVSEEFQKSCKTLPLIHQYPVLVFEGAEFNVSLITDSGQTLGPFKNYHWSKNKIIKVGEINGWVLKESKILKTNMKDKFVWPTYTLFTFRRK